MAEDPAFLRSQLERLRNSGSAFMLCSFTCAIPLMFGHMVSTRSATARLGAMAVAQGTKAEIITTKRTSTGPQPSRTRFGRLRAHLAEFAVGGRAAREVYDTLELRILIFSLVDRDTLAGMMRLEVAAVESVAGVLYRRVAGLYAHNMDTTTVSLSLESAEMI